MPWPMVPARHSGERSVAGVHAPGASKQRCLLFPALLSRLIARWMRSRGAPNALEASAAAAPGGSRPAWRPTSAPLALLSRFILHLLFPRVHATCIIILSSASISLIPQSGAEVAGESGAGEFSRHAGRHPAWLECPLLPARPPLVFRLERSPSFCLNCRTGAGWRSDQSTPSVLWGWSRVAAARGVAPVGRLAA